MVTECHYTSQQAAPFPLTTTPSHGGARPQSNTILSAHSSPQPKWHLDRFSRFCTAHDRVSLCFTTGRSIPPYNYPFPRGSGPQNTILSANSSPQPKCHLDRFSRSCTDDHRASLYFTTGRPSPSKLPLPMGGCGPPSNTWFFGPTRVPNPNGISTASTVLAGLTGVTDQHTDRLTDHTTRCITTGHIYVRSTGDAA